jgi:hypothetical protein
LVAEDSVTDMAVTGPLGAAVDGEADPDAPPERVPLKTRAHSPTARLEADTVVVTEYVVALETVTAVVVPAALPAVALAASTVTTKPVLLVEVTVPARSVRRVPPPAPPGAPDGR